MISFSYSDVKDFFASKWGIRLLIVGGILASIWMFYLWAYYKGYNACADKQAQRALQVEIDNTAANSDALSRELIESNKRTRQETIIKTNIENRNEPSDHDPAPDVVQSVFDGLRDRKLSDHK